MLKLGVQIVWMFSSVYTLSVLQTSLSLQTPVHPFKIVNTIVEFFYQKKPIKFSKVKSQKNQVIEKEKNIRSSVSDFMELHLFTSAVWENTSA